MVGEGGGGGTYFLFIFSAKGEVVKLEATLLHQTEGNLLKGKQLTNSGLFFTLRRRLTLKEKEAKQLHTCS